MAALTDTEIAQTRQLISQEAPLLSLASNEATITSKLGATKVNLSQLPAASTLADADIMLVRQGTTDKSVPVSVIKTTLAVGAASETQAGIVRLATDAETQAGALRTVAVDPAAMHVALTGLVGDVRNGKMSVAAAGSTGTYTADQVIVATSLGGAEYRISALSQTVNLATTGAGGMDTGTAPLSGFVALYAIYNPTTAAKSVMAVNATSAAAPNVYGGANLPTGYTASGLVAVWPTNASGQFAVGFINDKRFIGSAIGVLVSTNVVSGTPTSLSLASAAPFNAKKVNGYTEFTAIGSSANMGMTVASNAANIGLIKTYGVTTVAGQSVDIPFALDLVTPQTLFYTTFSSGTSSFSIILTAYEI